MNQDLVQKIRDSVAPLLNKPTADLNAPALYEAISAEIENQLALRKQAHGAGSTLTLNALLAAQLDMRLKVFRLKREPITAN